METLRFHNLFAGSEVMGTLDRDHTPKENADRYRTNDNEVLSLNESREFTETVVLSTGEVRHFVSLKFPFANRQGQRLLGGISFDVTERKRAEEALRFSQFCIDSSPDTILWVDSNARIFYANRAASQKLGYSPEELQGLSLHVLHHHWDKDAFELMKQMLKSRKSITVESVHRARSGSLCPVELSIHYLEFEGSEYSCCMARDITERKRAENELSHQAQHDLLTGLPNRRLLETRLARVLEDARSKASVIGVLYLDLDGFKLVNDTLGHVAGDNLLKQVSLRLARCIKESRHAGPHGRRRIHANSRSPEESAERFRR